MSYATKVYKALGGDELVVESGGKVTLKAGSTLENTGDFFTSVTFDDTQFTVTEGEVALASGVAAKLVTFDAEYFTVSEGEVTLKSEVAALLTIVDNIPTVDPADDGVTIWNDNGVLKVSGASGG